MALIDILNQVNCGGSNANGTSIDYCKFDLNRVTTIGLVQRKYAFQDDEINLLTGVQLLQQQGKLIILQGVRAQVDNTAEDNIKTYDGSGEKSVISKYPYEWTFTFENGLAWHTAVQFVNSNKQYDLVMWDDKGTCFLATSEQGEVYGLSTIMVNVNKYMSGAGTDSSTNSITIQVNRSQFDNYVRGIVSENLDYTADLDLDGYKDLEITLTAPADTETTISFTVKTKLDNHLVAIEGLEKEDFLLIIAGATVVPTTLTAGLVPGEYSFTVPALATAEVITLKTRDSVNSTDIINVDSILYKSNTATTVVTA